jgi:hypothetical protein
MEFDSKAVAWKVIALTAFESQASEWKVLVWVAKKCSLLDVDLMFVCRVNFSANAHVTIAKYGFETMTKSVIWNALSLTYFRLDQFEQLFTGLAQTFCSSNLDQLS